MECKCYLNQNSMTSTNSTTYFTLEFQDFEKETKDLANQWKELENKKLQLRKRMTLERDDNIDKIRYEREQLEQSKERWESEKRRIQEEKDKLLIEMNKIIEDKNSYQEALRKERDDKLSLKNDVEMNIASVKREVSLKI